MTKSQKETKTLLQTLPFIHFGILEYLKHAHFHVKGSVKCFGLVDRKIYKNGRISYDNNNYVATRLELLIF